MDQWSQVRQLVSRRADAVRADVVGPSAAFERGKAAARSGRRRRGRGARGGGPPSACQHPDGKQAQHHGAEVIRGDGERRQRGEEHELCAQGNRTWVRRRVRPEVGGPRRGGARGARGLVTQAAGRRKGGAQQ